MVGFTLKVMNDERGTTSNGRDGMAAPVETMMTAYSSRLAADS